MTQDAGWISWPGGTRPVAHHQFVDVQLRSGSICYEMLAGELYWDQTGASADVVNYRPASSQRFWHSTEALAEGETEQTIERQFAEFVKANAKAAEHVKASLAAISLRLSDMSGALSRIEDAGRYAAGAPLLSLEEKVELNRAYGARLDAHTDRVAMSAEQCQGEAPETNLKNESDAEIRPESKAEVQSGWFVQQGDAGGLFVNGVLQDETQAAVLRGCLYANKPGPVLSVPLNPMLESPIPADLRRWLELNRTHQHDSPANESGAEIQSEPKAEVQSDIPRPEPLSIWRHKSGRYYQVLFIANDVENPKANYPVTVVYRGLSNGKTWSGALSDWHRRMTLDETHTPAQSECQRIAGNICRGILVHGFENDPDVEKVIMGQSELIAPALQRWLDKLLRQEASACAAMLEPFRRLSVSSGDFSAVAVNTALDDARDLILKRNEVRS